ncbi:MAG: oligoendopeptidase F [Chloroflexota bacterium]|nr:oligoendopeptidase F [Chloroflexota bacterium]MDQ5865921.1 oligoendopeptidase F [Chloroflexota bacterium]
MVTKAVPTRSEIADEHKWDLEAIYSQDATWEEDFNSLMPMVERLSGYRGRLGDSAQTLLEALRLRDELGQVLERVIVYSKMRRDEDNANARYQALSDRAFAQYARVQEALAFVSPELLSVGQEKINGFMQELEPLKLHEHEMDDLFREKEHMLSEREEALLAGAGEIAGGPETIFDMLTTTDMVYGTIKDEEGSDVELSHGRYIRYIMSSDRRVRRDAFLTYHKAYAQNRNTIASTYATQVKADIFFSRARKYGSSLEMSLSKDNIPLSVYTGLIDAVHENLPQIQRYLELRKRVLQLDELHMWDLHVPMLPEINEEIPYERGTQMVSDSLAPLGAEYNAAVREGFTSRWSDVFESVNKTSGAYSWGTYGVHPFILLNYQDTLRDVFTVAHEMGHAIHSYFSNKNQPFLYAGYTLFVAEVASTLNEELLIHHLLTNSDDKNVKLAVVNYSLEQFRTTLYRQTMFAEFEKIAHERAEAGEALTADMLSEVHYDLNKQYYPGVNVDPEIAIEWARIPHFYRSFYVYKYSTGMSAAVALSQQIINEGQPAVDRYLRFLSRGGSDYSINLLRDAGVDMASPDPVRQALQMFGKRLDQMESLLGIGEAVA